MHIVCERNDKIKHIKYLIAIAIDYYGSWSYDR